jgi:hypothetical protein
MRLIKEFEQIIGQLSLLGRGQRADGGDFHVPITLLSLYDMNHGRELGLCPCKEVRPCAH